MTSAAAIPDSSLESPKQPFRSRSHDVDHPSLARRLYFEVSPVTSAGGLAVARQAQHQQDIDYGPLQLSSCSHEHLPTAKLAAQRGDIKMLKFLDREYGQVCLQCDELAEYAAAAGHLHVLKAFRWKGRPTAPVHAAKCLVSATRHGHKAISSWLIRNYTAELQQPDACIMAARLNCLPALRMLRSLGGSYGPWDGDVAAWASYHGNVQILTFYGETSPVNTSKCALIAAEAGHVHVLIWLKQTFAQSFSFDEVCMLAVQQASLKALKTLVQMQPDTVLPESVAAAAACEGHLSIVQWLFYQTFQYQHSPCILYVDSLISAIHQGQDRVVHWLFEQNVYNLTSVAAMAVNLLSEPAVSFFARSYSHIFTPSFCSEVLTHPAFMGHLAIVQMAWPACGDRGLALGIIKATIRGSPARMTPPRSLQCPAAHYTPAHVGLLLWLVDKIAPLTQGEQRQLNGWAAEVNSFLLVQLAACSGPVSPVAWDPHAWSTAAACGSLYLLRWLLNHPPSDLQSHPEATTIQPECCNGRMLLLVHVHSWKVPQQLQDHYEMADACRSAFYRLAGCQRKHLPQSTSLAHLHESLIVKIACLADIDFNSRHSPGR